MRTNTKLKQRVELDPRVTLVGFTKQPDIGDLEDLLGRHGFFLVDKLPVRGTRTFVNVYSPASRFRERNPQFSFSYLPLSAWTNVTKNEILAEGILIINYPLSTELSQKYGSLFSELSARPDVIMD